jgi:hypothetical protein
MTSLIRAFNTLLPFTDPSTPLWRDIFHTLILCTVLYIAPGLHLERFLDGTWRRTADASDTPVPTVGSDTIAPPPGSGDDQIHDEEQEPVVRGEPVEVPDDRPVERDAVPFPAAVNFEIPQQDQDQDQDDEEAGPVNGQPARRRDPNREVGAKKARSLARRNQQRAYNEFLREQGEAERAEWARDAEKRDEELRAEKGRRMVVEAQIQERERKARVEKKERDERERKEELDAVRSAANLISDALKESGAIRIQEVAKSAKRDGPWVEQLAKKEGVLGMKTVKGKKQVTMLTGHGWIVRVDQDAMTEAYQRAAKWKGKDDGKISWEQLGRIVQETLRDRSA